MFCHIYSFYVWSWEKTATRGNLSKGLHTLSRSVELLLLLWFDGPAPSWSISRVRCLKTFLYWEFCCFVFLAMWIRKLRLQQRILWYNWESFLYSAYLIMVQKYTIVNNYVHWHVCACTHTHTHTNTYLLLVFMEQNDCWACVILWYLEVWSAYKFNLGGQKRKVGADLYDILFV